MADDRQGAPPRVHPRTLALAAAGVAVAVLIASVAVALASDPLPDAGAAEPTDAAGFRALDLDGRVDSDGDGLADATENYVTGTDPGNWSSNGDPIPDGWLAKAGRDPLRAGMAYQPAARPPADAVPAAWGPDGVNRLTPTLWDVYAHDRPDDWDEETMGPWENGLDPDLWDQNGDGLPDGFLLRHGLDPTADLGDTRPAGASGLTVAEAYQHATDPTRLDTDGDGLPDRAEIAGAAYAGVAIPPSDPTRFDTGGAGVCDGYLAHHGIDPADGDAARADLDRDGATTAEEAAWSLEALGPTACSGGDSLDPHDPYSGGAEVPDGWLIRYGLNPLEAGVDEAATEGSGEQALDARDEYNANRPPGWSEATDGPWWGGTDPTLDDTDGDGLTDAWELRGYTILVVTDVGSASAVEQQVRPDPTRADTDGDGVSDGTEAKADPPTDATRRDTDLDGLSDQFEFQHPHLDPLRADTAGDYLTDGQRHLLLTERSASHLESLDNDCPGECLWTSVLDWLGNAAGALDLLPLDASDAAALTGPDGDLDGDGVTNIIDPDIDGDGIPNGAEVDTAQYARTSFGLGPLDSRPATDPFNADTDGDGLRDAWEVTHGVPAGDRYDLDPSDWDSDGDDVGDGAEDPDGDSITWFSFHTVGTAREATPHTFTFDNLAEQNAGTDPRRKSTSGDGLLDGWKVFWGIEYPSKIGPDAVARGEVYPGAPGPYQLPADRPVPTLEVDESDVAISSVTTSRFTTLPGLDARLPHESAETTVVTAFPNVDGRTVYRLVADRPFTFLDAQASYANPYVDDTDGDGMPDAWEWAHTAPPPEPTCTGFNGPAPAVPDGHVHADGDDLTNLQEYDARLRSDLPAPTSLHPLCPDHDLGGLDDGEETRFHFDPTDPYDDLADVGDTDGDGVDDLEERRTLRTDPLSLDSDGDGLLDGGHLPPPGQAPYAHDDPEAVRLTELGIAFARDGTGLRFLGEAGLGTDPLDADPLGTGVPQGWMAARKLDPNTMPSNPARLRDAYTIGIPGWWDEADHGPWWGGGVTDAERNDPRAARQATDLDADGLLDAGEDPLPAVNRHNVPAPVTVSAHPGLDAWTGDVDPLDATASPLERRLAAQAHVNPRVVVPAGGLGREPDPASLDDPPAVARGTPVLDLAAVPDTLRKGEPFQVGGTVRLDGTGVPGVTVVAELAGQPVGAAFTDATGAFVLDGALQAAHEATVPPHALVLMGQTERAEWTADMDAVPLGGQDLRLHTYATPATAPHTDQWPALHRTEEHAPVTVRTPAGLSVSLPPEVDAGDAFEVVVRVSDGASGPLQEPVRITTPRGSDVHTPVDGAVTLTFQSGTGDAGPFQVEARLIPDSPHVDPATADGTASILLPVTVTMRPLDDRVDAGQTLRVEGTVRHDLGPAGGVPLTVRGTGGEPVAAVTSADGSYSVLLPVPDAQPPGDLVVQVSAAKTATTGAGGISDVTRVLAKPVLRDTSPAAVPLGDPVLLRGTLRTAGGDALPGADVHYRLGDLHGTLTTDLEGGFEAELDWVPPVGPSVQTLQFDGDAQHAAAQTTSERYPVSDTFIALTPGEVLRGEPLPLEARLTDAADRPVAGAALTISHAGASSHAVSDDAGVVRVTLDTSAWALGSQSVTVAYAGSGDGSLRPTQATSDWRVVSALRVEVPEGPFHAGDTPPAPRLVDAGSGDPVVRTLTVTDPDGTARVLTTSADGRFDLFGSIPLDAQPTTLTWRVASDADDAYPALSQEIPLRVVSPSTLSVLLSGDPVAGKETQVLVSVHDGRDLPGEGEVRVLLDGRVAGRAPLADGSVRLPLVPDEPGPAVLAVEFLGSGEQAPAHHEETLDVLRPTQLRLDVTEENGRARIQVTATRDGEPLAFRDLHLSIEDLPGGIALKTDGDGRATFEHARSRDGVAVAVRLSAESGEEPSLATTVLGTPGPTSPSLTSTLPDWIGLTLVPLLFVALVVASSMLWRLRSPLDQELRETLRTLRGRGAAEEVILHGYYVLQRAALRKGWLDDEAATPRVLQETLAARVKRMPEKPLDALVGLFERARYGGRPMGPDDRDLAVRALNAIRRGTAWGARA